MSYINTIYVKVPVHITCSAEHMRADERQVALAAVRSAGSGAYVSMNKADYCEGRMDLDSIEVLESVQI